MNNGIIYILLYDKHSKHLTKSKKCCLIEIDFHTLVFSFEKYAFCKKIHVSITI